MNSAQITKTSLRAALLLYASVIAQTPVLWNGLSKSATKLGLNLNGNTIMQAVSR